MAKYIMNGVLHLLVLGVCWTVVSATRYDSNVHSVEPGDLSFASSGRGDGIGSSIGLINVKDNPTLDSTGAIRGTLQGSGGVQLLGSGGGILGGNGAFAAVGQSLPQYEVHIQPRLGGVPVASTVTDTVTKTHKLRIPVTSDVWITSVTMVTVSVTQLTTERQYVPGVADTVTSVVRVTHTDVETVTRTVQTAPTWTQVSVFTVFRTVTKTNELWQPIVHVHTQYEIRTVPVLATQTLLQRLYTTVTATGTAVMTIFVQDGVVPRSGGVTAAIYTHY